LDEKFLKIGLSEKNKVVFDFVFQYHYSGLCAYAESIINNQEAVEDIVQELFVTIWVKSEQLVIEGPIKNYLFSSVKNRCLDYLKHQKVKSQSIIKLKAKVTLNNETPENWVVQSELEEKIEECLKQLPTRCQEIFRLSRFKGLKNQEIASLLGISKRTVELQISNALKILRKDLQPYLQILLLPFL
jgi:RNA polymerase sigma-70 factor (ECF subfamily)